MNSQSWPTLWAAFAPAAANHLWQSTLVAVVAGILAFALRRDHARTRFWLWLAASTKFLIPFAPLVALGNRLAWSRGSADKAGLYVAMQEISQPFTQSSASAMSPAAPAAVSSGLAHLLPLLICAVWLCGFLALLFLWCLRWRRISSTIRGALPLREGREVESLRRLEQLSGIEKPVGIFLSSATLEPGIVGVTRPVLLWPEGVSDRLDDAQLQAILTHELWHVRRRDNLAALVHMLVEAVFWFYPLVWWLGSRLVEERERACDEEVLAFGSEREVYAESILKVCEFCVESPLACVSGVTGADLKKRMVHIMSEHVVRKLNLGKKLLLSAAALGAIAAPIVFGLVHATPSRAQSQIENASASAAAFDSVSIKPSEISAMGNGSSHMIRMMFGPDGLHGANVSLRALIQEAYGVQGNQVVGPSELLDAAYDIEAKVGPPASNHGDLSVVVRDQPGFDPHRPASKQMLQALLADRFKLAMHSETKELPSYALVVSEGGAKISPTQFSHDLDAVIVPDGQPVPKRRMSLQIGGGDGMTISAEAASTADFAEQLSHHIGVAVVDKTGLEGRYDFNLHWTSDSYGSNAAIDHPTLTAISGSAFFRAIEDQLGLKLEPQQGSMQVLVVDHVEQPSEN
jgi:bla regulator protein BlaR1